MRIDRPEETYLPRLNGLRVGAGEDVEHLEGPRRLVEGHLLSSIKSS